ncbi:MAG: hypothetical protein NVS1B11_19830 [Terriglobales bacterium]
MLDIAAGHGLFGIAVLRANQNAEVTAVDWKSVLEVARENANKSGVADRYKTLPGSIFDVDMKTEYDLILLPNFLHHFDAPTIVQLLVKLHRGLKFGGKVATLEFVPDEDRVSPATPASFALIMLAQTPGKDAYMRAELEQMFNHAGFRAMSFTPCRRPRPRSCCSPGPEKLRASGGELPNKLIVQMAIHLAF